MFKSHKLIQIKKKTGFTLAEVLVTLAIIGVVASLTILTLIQNIKNDQVVSGVKKAYSEFSQAYTSFIKDDIDMDTVFAGDLQHANVLNQFAAKLNCIKNCGTDTGCFPDVTYKYLNGNNWQNINQTTDKAKAILADGSVIFIKDLTGTCTTDLGDGPLDNTCGKITNDINGFKGPNQLGRDVFQFYITRNGILPFGSNNDGLNGNCTSSDVGNSCASKILTDGAVNY